jgi:hypothetical protein
MACLDLIDFKPENYASAEYLPSDPEPLIDLKNGYYEITSEEQVLCQAAKFNNTDGSVTLMITGFFGDMQCSWYETYAYLIFPDGKKYVEISTDDLNINKGLRSFIDNPELDIVLSSLLDKLKGNYLSETDGLDVIYGEMFDLHYVLPQKGTDLTITLTICDYIPTNEIEVSEEDWNIIENSIPELTFAYDKKFIRFK